MKKIIISIVALVLLTSCEKEEVSNDISVQIVNQLTDTGKQYDIKLIAVSTYEELMDNELEGELVQYGETSEKYILNGDGAETIYSDTWTIHFAYKAIDSNTWLYEGTAPANEIRHQTLRKGDSFKVYLSTANLANN